MWDDDEHTLSDEQFDYAVEEEIDIALRNYINNCGYEMKEDEIEEYRLHLSEMAYGKNSHNEYLIDFDAVLSDSKSEISFDAPMCCHQSKTDCKCSFDEHSLTHGKANSFYDVYQYLQNNLTDGTIEISDLAYFYDSVNSETLCENCTKYSTYACMPFRLWLSEYGEKVYNFELEPNSEEDYSYIQPCDNFQPTVNTDINTVNYIRAYITDFQNLNVKN